jgi:metal-sulfur cluster biosynthetic enzyme
MLSEAGILDLLRDCIEPVTKLDIVDLGLVHGIETGPDPVLEHFRNTYKLFKSIWRRLFLEEKAT